MAGETNFLDFGFKKFQYKYMEMFNEAFELLKRSWRRLLKIYLITVALTLGLVFIAGVLGLLVYLTKFYLLVLLAIPLVILLMVVSVAISAGMMLVVYDENIAVKEAMKKGISKFLPLFWAGLLTGFIVFGGFFPFVIPAVVFAFLLIFTKYEIVLNDQGVVSALKRSIYLAKSNVGEVIVRVGAFILFSIVVLGLVPAFLGLMGMMGKIFSFLYSLILNFVYSWYSVCYFVLLYKSLKDKTPGETGKGLLILGVISILGWVVFVLGLIALARTISPPAV